MTLSPEQLAVCSALTDSADNILVTACAGGAKTTTMCAAACAFGPGRPVVALAFNKDAALALQSKMPYWVTSSTFHSFCYDALGRHLGRKPRADGNKCKWILKELMPDWKSRREIEDTVLTLVSRAKSSSTECDRAFLSTVAERFSLDTDQSVLSLAGRILEQCTAPPFKTIDFDDMLWLTLRLDVTFPPVALVLLDEVQDTNSVQRALLARILQKVNCPYCNGQREPDCVGCNGQGFTTKSRLLAVGDPAQSIYGFRGASSDAMTALRDDFNMRELGLSVSYRCSRAVVKEAQKYL